MNGIATDWVSLPGGSQSLLAMKHLKMNQGVIAAKGGSLSWNPKCPSYYANSTVPLMVCY